MALTVKRVERLKAPGRYGDGRGLYLQINEQGAKSWVFRYQRGPRERFMGLGPLHTVDLEAARERARAARLLLLDGTDPLAARQKAQSITRAAETRVLDFATAAQQYFDQHSNKWRNARHRTQFTGSIKLYVNPIIGRLSVADIDTVHVLKVLEQPVKAHRNLAGGRFWIARPETASRLRGRIESVLDWATVRGYRSGDNPARWKGHLSEVLPAQKAAQVHYPALPYGELPGLLVTLRTTNDMGARALEFLILTAARSGEVKGARWDEMDLAQAVWTVPGTRMKAGREHRVPLSDRAIELLRGVPRERGNAHVFPGVRNAAISDRTMIAVLERMKLKATVHGMRSAFRDWAGERTAYQPYIVEMALAHTVGNQVERAYARSDLLDRRRKLMQDWATFLSRPSATAEVTPLRPRQ